MALDSHLEALQKRASRALGNHRVEDAVQKVKAIIGPQHIPNSEAEAQAAMERLRRGEQPSPEQLEALEIVVRLLRPVVFSRNGALDDLPDDNRNLYSQEDKDRWSAFRAKVNPLLYSIGRIERGTSHRGTGFLVADGLLATNRHVLAALTSGAEVLAPGAARVVFKQEVNATNPPEQIVSIDGVARIHPTLDMVLLRLRPLGRPVVTVSSVTAPEETTSGGRRLPGERPRQQPAVPLGRVQRPVRHQARGARRGARRHRVARPCSTIARRRRATRDRRCSTCDTGTVVGIHRAGFFMYRNEAVDADALRAFVAS